HLIDAEARWPLAWRIVFECRQELANDRRTGHNYAGSVRHQPVIICIGSDIGALIGIGAEIEEFWNAQLGEGLRPDAHRSVDALLFKYDLPVLDSRRYEISVIVEIDEFLARAVRLLGGQIGKLVVAVEMHLEGLAGGLITGQQLLLDVGV